MAGDYDGDGQTDVAVFRPSDGGWYIVMSTQRQGVPVHWGGAERHSGARETTTETARRILRSSARPSGGWYILHVEHGTGRPGALGRPD